jgi:hypothetical protein
MERATPGMEGIVIGGLKKMCGAAVAGARASRALSHRNHKRAGPSSGAGS